jgi:hypothetical protein
MSKLESAPNHATATHRSIVDIYLQTSRDDASHGRLVALAHTDDRRHGYLYFGSLSLDPLFLFLVLQFDNVFQCFLGRFVGRFAAGDQGHKHETF